MFAQLKWKKLKVAVWVLCVLCSGVSATEEGARNVRADSKLYLTFSKRTIEDIDKPKAYEVHVAAPEIVIEQGHENNVYERLNEVSNQEKVILEADRVLIRDPIHIPGADVEIHARELVFENASALIDTSAEPWRVAAHGFGQDGEVGRDAGDIELYVGQIIQSESALRFRMNGANGQDPGPGKPGEPGSPDGVIDTKPKCKRFNRYYCINKTGFRSDVVEKNQLKKDSPWPGNGEDAIAAGKPGDGGNGGNLTSSVDPQSFAFEQKVGSPGTYDGRIYSGGERANPHMSFKVTWDYVSRGFGPGQWVATLKEDGVNVAARGKNAQQLKKGKEGKAGTVQFINADWYTPRISAVSWQYIDDLYFRGDRRSAAEQTRKHLEFLESPERNFSDSEKGEAFALERKFSQRMHQMHLMKDYFGHPMAWVPPLSLESYLQLYKEETKHAIKRLYLAKRVLFENTRKETRIAETEELQRSMREEIEVKSKEHAEVLQELPAVQKQLDDLNARSINANVQLNSLSLELDEIARRNVENRHKVKWWRKGLKIMGGLAMVFPVGQPFVGLAGAAAMGVAEYNKHDPLGSVLQVGGNVSAVIQNAEAEASSDGDSKPSSKVKKAVELSEEFYRFKESWGKRLLGEEKPEEGSEPQLPPTGLDEILPEIHALFKEINKKDPTARQKFMKRMGELKGEGKFAKDFLEKIIEGMAMQEVPGVEAANELDEVSAELEDLKKAEPRFQELDALVKELLLEKGLFDAKVKDLLQTLDESSACIVNNLVQIAEMSTGVNAEYENALTPGAELAVREIQARAERTLRKYHYYLQKAYSYRLLKSYVGEADLRPLFDRMEKLLSNPNQVLSREDYEDLHALYHGEVSMILEELLQSLDEGEVEHEETIRVHLTPDELSQLSLGTVPLNLLERACVGNLPGSVPAPCIDESAEDVRIARVEVEDFELEGNSPVPPHFHILVEHSGLSKFWRKGKMHLFRLYDGSSKIRQSWRNTLYDNGEIKLHGTSDSHDSLIRAFLPDKDGGMVFIRPSAWGDLNIRLKSEGKEMPRLKRLTFKVVFTYRDQPAGSPSWKQHFEEQNEGIRRVYQQTLGREPTPVELSSKRSLRDLGYSWERIGQLVRQLSAPGFSAPELSVEGIVPEVEAADPDFERVE